VLVAQLVGRSIPTTEVRGLNPVIAKLLYKTFVYCWKDENKDKEAENGQLKNINLNSSAITPDHVPTKKNLKQVFSIFSSFHMCNNVSISPNTRYLSLSFTHTETKFLFHSLPWTKGAASLQVENDATLKKRSSLLRRVPAHSRRCRQSVSHILMTF